MKTAVVGALAPFHYYGEGPGARQNGSTRPRRHHQLGSIFSKHVDAGSHIALSACNPGVSDVAAPAMAGGLARRPMVSDVTAPANGAAWHAPAKEVTCAAAHGGTTSPTGDDSDQNGHLLGASATPSHWRCPYEKVGVFTITAYLNDDCNPNARTMKWKTNLGCCTVLSRVRRSPSTTTGHSCARRRQLCPASRRAHPATSKLFTGYCQVGVLHRSSEWCRNGNQ